MLHTEYRGSAILEVKEELHSLGCLFSIRSLGEGGWWNNKNGKDHEGEAMFCFLVREKTVTKKNAQMSL